MDKLSKFVSATILLPVIDEYDSLKQTINIILKHNSKEIESIFLLVHNNKTKKKSLELCEYLKKNNPKIKIIFQKLPNLGGAFRDSINHIQTSHTVMMCSDLETDPDTVRDLIKFSNKYPDQIIQASRWIDGTNFYGYGKFKVLLNYIFQKLFSFLYKTDCSDMTYGFRIIPSYLLKRFSWEMTDHSFVFEVLLKPLISNIKIYSIKTKWEKRKEGKSHNTSINYLKYLFIGIIIFIRFKLKKKVF